MPEWASLALFLFGAVLVAVVIGIPVAFALGGVSVIALFVLIGPNAVIGVAIQASYYSSVFTLIAVPLFILMADILAFSGASEDLFRAIDAWVGRVPGSMALGSTLACGLFGAACGSSAATAATIGMISVPEMRKRGYDMRLATGAVAAGGTLGILIPPSIPMIIYGTVTETSVGRLFMGGVLPGLLMITIFSGYIILSVMRKPTLAPMSPRATWGERLSQLWKVGPILLVAFAVLGSIYAGIATPSESAGVGALVSIFICVAYRRLKWSNLLPAMLRAVQTTCFVFFIVFGAMAFAYVLAYLRVPQEMARAVISSGMAPLMFVITANFLFAFLGCFLDPSSIIVLTMPTLAVLCKQLGIDLVWFGVVMTINMEMANLTPPVGLNCFVIQSISNTDIRTIFRGALPFMALLVIGISLVLFFPPIATWLPSLMR